MGTLQFKNNASTTLSGSINDSQTSITVNSSSGFPSLVGSDYFYATMYEVSGTTEINIEIIKVTATTGSNWTIVRAQDGTTARSRNGVTTCFVELRWTAASSALMLQKDNNLSDLASASAARTSLGLGSIATQDASNVNITGGSVSGVSIEGIDSTTTISDNVDSTKKIAFEVSGVSTGTTRTLTAPNASGTLALTSDLSAYQPLDADLTAVAGLSASGLIARTGSGTASVRAITQPAAGITVTNGDGVAGNPTLGLANDLAGVEALNTTGFVRRTAADTWSASALVDNDLPGALTGKTYNALTLTAAATGFSIAGGTSSKTLTVSNSLTLAGTDATTITFPSTSGTLPLNNQTFFLGTTSIAINRTSGAISLTGVSIDGSAGSATSATSATTATNLASGVLGSLPYQSAAATTALLAPNTSTTRNFLRMTGTGTAGAVPAWDTVTKTDVGLANVEDTALSTWAGSTNITTLGTVTSGTWNASTIGIARGGTGATTALAAFDALSPATTLGDLIYSDGTDNVRLAGNTTTNRRFLRQTGTGTVSAAPAWDGLVDGDIPTALTGKTYNGLTLTAAATGFTVAGGTSSKTLTVSNSLTLAGTDASTLNIGAGGTLGSAAFTASTAYAPTAGSSSIVTVGVITSGTWQGSAIGISSGGTGATSKTAAFNALTPNTTLGDLSYHDGTNEVRLAGSTSASKRFLTQTGTGTVSAAPAWGALADADIPSTLNNKTFTGTTNAASLQLSSDLTLSGGTANGVLYLNGSKVATSGAAITFDGTNLGVGTNSPVRLVTINGGVGAGFTDVLQLSAGTTAANSGPGLTFNINYGDYGAWKNWQTAAIRSAGENPAVNYLGYLAFYTNSGSGASAITERMRLDASGRLGIGTTSPSQRLTVNGPSFGAPATSGTTQTNGAIRIIAPSTTGVLDIGIGAAGTNQWIQSTDSGNLGVNYNLLLNPNGGDVSIGTTNAYDRVTIQGGRGGGVTGGLYVLGSTTDANWGGGIALANSSGTVYGSFFASTNGLFLSGGASTGVIFNASGAEAMRLNASGNLGVGQASPAARLDVNGNQAANITAVAALDINCSAGNYFTKTINGNSTFTVSSVPASRAYAFTLELTHTSGTVTWFSGVQWPGGTAPTLTTGKVHLFSFVTDDGGTSWRGASQVNYNS